MEMEVMIPQSPVDFNFDSACTTPYISAPSSPQRFGTFFYSAPTSPARISAFYNDISSSSPAAASGVPFDWEEKPGIAKSKQEANSNVVDDDNDDDDRDDIEDFAFDFSGQLGRSPLPADELFDGGKIKPLKPPPKFHPEYGNNRPVESPRSPKSPKQFIKEAFSPRHRRKDFDPFAAALEQTRKDNSFLQDKTEKRRGRERTATSAAASNSRHEGTRSLSPIRVSDLLFDRDNNQEPTKNSSISSSFSSSAVSLFSQWYGKWKLKNLLLFRSASEGRAADKDPLKKYTLLKKTHQEDVKNCSFRSTDSSGSVSSRRRGAPVSAHELHYTVNRAASEEMKKRTSLPYRHGLLGCLGFNPAVPDFSKGFVGSMTRG